MSAADGHLTEALRLLAHGLRSAGIETSSLDIKMPMDDLLRLSNVLAQANRQFAIPAGFKSIIAQVTYCGFTFKAEDARYGGD